MSIAIKARRNKKVSGAQGIIGETGIAQTSLSPRGKIFVHGELWDAVSSSDVSVGQSVVVRRIDGLLLQVEPAAVAHPTPTPVAL
ncbi:MAG: NfeD family protein [Candidatus Sulfotelmatobacter sp.]|jgi:membrane-bound serine protease (ClpP class)